MTDALIYKRDVQKLVCRLNGCVGTKRNFDNCEKRCPDFKTVDELPTVEQANNDLISRQAAFDFIKDHSYPVRYDRTSIEQGMTLTGIEQALNEAPSVQPEQEIGHWIEECGDLVCSKCKFVVSDPYYLGKAVACPNCGTKMEDDTDV